MVAVAASPDALLDAALRDPGSYNQMCSLPPPVKADVPLPIYGQTVPRHFNLSEKNAAKLLAQRDAVAKALAARLEAMDLARLPPKPAPKESKAFPPPATFSTHTLSGVLLEIVIALKAAEALPGLLKVEAQLDAILAAAEKDPSAPIPELEVDGIWYPSQLQPVDYVKMDGKYEAKPKPDAAAILRKQHLLNCRVYQREVLSVLARLLRDAHFQPLLDSDIEKSYAAGLQEAVAKSKQLSDFKNPGDIPPDDRDYIKWDPLYNLPVAGSWPKAELPFTRKLRAQIRGFAEQFLAAKK
jgi:hypothetical protein